MVSIGIRRSNEMPVKTRLEIWNERVEAISEAVMGFLMLELFIVLGAMLAGLIYIVVMALIKGH
jgi:hypothetical protein